MYNYADTHEKSLKIVNFAFEMERVDIDIEKACDVLRRGGLILYPTDTVWGIGCDACNSEAVKKVFELKRRADSKALIVLVGDERQLLSTVDDVPDVALQLIEVSDRPVTIVYDQVVNVAPEVMAADGSVAVRLTSEPVSKRLCRMLRRPLVSTSANISGTPAPSVFAEISPEILNGVDYVMKQGRDYPPSKPSIIIRISSDSSFKIIRD